MHRLKKFAVLGVSLIMLSGCAEVLLLGAGAGLGVGAYKYVDGNLAVEYPLEYTRAWDSSNRALERLQISITSSNNENGNGLIEAVRRDGKKVTIKVKDKGMGVSIVAVRVGTMGNRLEAQNIHDEIASAAGI